MRKGLVVIGSSLLALGVLMVLLLWPVVGYETKDTFDKEDVKGGETIRYVGEITNITESGEIFVLELDNGELEAYTKEKNFELNENVLVTVKFGNDAANWDENRYDVQKIPTIGGLFGLLCVILGFVILIAGFITRKVTIEDLIEISVQPVAPPPTSPTESSQIEQVTCPNCGKVFGVKGLTRPAKITCPECALEGILK